MPAPPTAFLTVNLPNGRRYGVSLFRVVRRNGLGSVCLRVVLVSVLPHSKESSPTTSHFGWGLSVPLALQSDDVYRQFTCVNHAIQPCTPSASALADAHQPHGSSVAFAGLLCPSGFTPDRYQSRMHR